jgi:succinate dehydrogenase / fumarate reductase cytochrome b subunit
MENKGPRDNRQGIWGWLSGGRYGLERKLYILHRLSGLALIFYLPIHIFVTTARIRGEAEWVATMEAVHNLLFVIGEYLLFIAFAFHALNGLRLVLVELGFFIGAPGKQVFPHVTSVNKQRPLVWIAMIIAAIAILLAGYDFLIQEG